MSLELEQITVGTPPLGRDGDTQRSANEKTNRNMTAIQGAVNNKLELTGGTLSGAAQFWYEAKGIAGGYALGIHYRSSGVEKLSIGALGNQDIAGNWQTAFMAAGPNGYDLSTSPSGVWVDYVGTLRTKGAWTHTGSATLNNNGAGVTFSLVSNAGTQSYVRFGTLGASRWAFGMDGSAETGGNAGDNLVVWRYSDSGAYQDIPLLINRSNGRVAINVGLDRAGTCVHTYPPGSYANVYAPTASGGYNYPHMFISGSGALIGSITANDTSVGFNSSSDYRLKQNYAPIVGALESVLRMRFYSGEFKAAPGTLVDYVIAHEQQEETPFAVFGEKDAVEKYPILREGADPNDVRPEDVVDMGEAIIPQQVDYSKLVPRLGAAIQDLSAALDAALGRIASLEARP